MINKWDETLPQVLCKPHYGNSNLQMGHTPFGLQCSLTTKEVKFRLNMKDYKWGKKWKFKSWKNFKGKSFPNPIMVTTIFKWGKTPLLPQVLCKPHYGNSHLEKVVCKWGTPRLVYSAL